MVNYDIAQIAVMNPWWSDPWSITQDRKLQEVDNANWKWTPKLINTFNLDVDSIYSLRGPRQVGKTTLMKEMIRRLITANKPTENIFFWSFERNNNEELHQILYEYLNWGMKKTGRKYLFLDEVCAVNGWGKELIYFANKGDLRECTVVVSGSQSRDIKQETELMPGRRGGDGKTPLDKILLPIKFSEYVELLLPNIATPLFNLHLLDEKTKQQTLFDLFEGNISKSIEPLMIHKTKLDALLERYLITGGIPSIINQYQDEETIQRTHYDIYLSAVTGDIQRLKLKEQNVKQILREVFKTLASPISWNNIVKNSEINNVTTVANYVEALQDLFTIGVSYKIDAQQKIHHHNKKIYVLDPFIFHALHGWANNTTDYYQNTKVNLLNAQMRSKIMESVVYNHLCLFAYNTNPRDLYDPRDDVFYYRDKKEREVDYIMRHNEQLYPFELKYQNEINSQDFNAFFSLNKGVLISKNLLGKPGKYCSIPVSLFLMLI